jgi:hypothetical protein
VQGPWSKVNGMVQYGVWLPPEQAIKFHPNLSPRQGSVDPSGVQ